MSPEMQQTEYPYLVRIETAAGQFTTVPVAFMTPKQVQEFLQGDFKRLVQEAGVQGARICVERATTADYQKVLEELGDWLRKARVKAA